MQEDSIAKDIQAVISLRSATDGVFIKALENDPYIQKLYLSSVPLQYRHRKCQREASSGGRGPDRLAKPGRLAQSKNGHLVFESEGEAEFVIREGQWDPEMAHRIELDMQVFSYDNKPMRLEFTFSGDLKIPYPRPWVELQSHELHCISIDLLQVYAYALNPKVKQLALRFRAPGIYKISRLVLKKDTAAFD